MFKNKTWKCVIYLGAKVFTFRPLTKRNFLRVKNLINGQVSLIMLQFPPPLILQPSFSDFIIEGYSFLPCDITSANLIYANRIVRLNTLMESYLFDYIFWKSPNTPYSQAAYSYRGHWLNTRVPTWSSNWRSPQSGKFLVRPNFYLTFA